MNAKNRNGIVRNDYHRKNRLENKSMHRTSFGRNVPVNSSASVGALQIPKFTKDELVQRALANWKDHHGAAFRLSKQKTSVERKCFEFIRHRQTGLDAALARTYGAAYLLAIREFCDAVIERYDWLRDECDRYYKEKEGSRRHQTFKVLKRQSVTSMQVADINERENQRPEWPLREEEEVPLFFNALSSLDQERFMYLPPFLKPDEVKERRFGEDANDRWWEWEEEKGLVSQIGRPDPKNGLVSYFTKTESQGGRNMVSRKSRR